MAPLPATRQALRPLRSWKQVEKRVDSLTNQLESIRAILDRIDQSKTDKMVRGGAKCVTLVLSGCPVLHWFSLVSAGHRGVPGRRGGAETLPE